MYKLEMKHQSIRQRMKKIQEKPQLKEQQRHHRPTCSHGQGGRRESWSAGLAERRALCWHACAVWYAAKPHLCLRVGRCGWVLYAHGCSRSYYGHGGLLLGLLALPSNCCLRCSNLLLVQRIWRKRRSRRTLFGFGAVTFSQVMVRRS